MQRKSVVQQKLNEGVTYFKNGEFGLAIIKLSESLQGMIREDFYEPEHSIRKSITYYYLGLCYAEMNYVINAVLRIKIALAYLDKNDYSTLAVYNCKIGTIYLKHGEFQDAINYFTTAVTFCRKGLVEAKSKTGHSYLHCRPGFENVEHVFSHRGMAYYKLTKYDEAIKDFTSALRIQVSHNSKSTYLHYRGCAYAEQGKIAEAIADYKLALHYEFFNGDIDSQFDVYRDLVDLLCSNADFSAVKKDEIFSAITALPDIDQIYLLLKCLDKNDPLGSRMWQTEFPWTGCSLDQGTLKKACDRLKQLKPDFVTSPPSDVVTSTASFIPAPESTATATTSTIATPAPSVVEVSIFASKVGNIDVYMKKENMTFLVEGDADSDVGIYNRL